MAEPVKNNEYILAHQEEFKAALERAREYFKGFEGVLGVGFGQKHSGNAYQDTISLVISVKEKKKEEDLRVSQRIPKTFEGFPTDVIVVLNMHPGICENDNNYNTIQGGIQIGPRSNNGSIPLGTLGCIVRKKNDGDRENVHLLSNKHVLYALGATAGSYIYHPYPPSPPNTTGAGPSNSLGPIEPLSFYGDVSYTPPGAAGPSNFFIDCATARIDIDSKCFGSTCTRDTTHYEGSIIDLDLNSANTISDVRSIIGDLTIVGQQVFKVGRTTGKTTGIVRWVDINGTMPTDFDDVTSPSLNISNLIAIEFDTGSTPTGLNCKGHPLFGEHGDSGALVVDSQNRAIGLLYGVPPPGAAAAAPCAACHILPVLDNLGICILTTSVPALPAIPGTSHCSCRAIDGSGLTLPPSTGTGGGGTIGIISGISALKNSENAAAFLQPEPLTEKQQEHLTNLLSELRSTARGRELHAAFAHVRREIGYLVRNCRPVTVAWHRNKGPGFFASFLNHLRGDLPEFPHQIGNAGLSVLLDKMEVELLRHGSIPLRETIQQYGDQLRSMLLNGNDASDFIEHLKKTEQV